MRLTAGDWELTAAPERGGAILSLTRAGRDILRPTAAAAAGTGTDDAFDFACFPLVPYANRIAFGTFNWNGTTHRIPRNHTAQDHPLHGVGWLVPWAVTASDATSIAMRLDHPGDEAWPWPFVAEQRLALSATGLTADLTIENSGNEAMPVSLGFHPYFAAAETLRFDATGVWLANDQMLPSRHAAADALGDWSAPGPLARPDLIDHCYTGWTGPATIARPDGDVLLEADGATGLHVYVPPGKAFFCAEPVTAMPDAVNHGAAIALAAGARASIVMCIRST